MSVLLKSQNVSSNSMLYDPVRALYHHSKLEFDTNSHGPPKQTNITPLECTMTPPVTQQRLESAWRGALYLTRNCTPENIYTNTIHKCTHMLHTTALHSSHFCVASQRRTESTQQMSSLTQPRMAPIADPQLPSSLPFTQGTKSTCTTK